MYVYIYIHMYVFMRSFLNTSLRATMIRHAYYAQMHAYYACMQNMHACMLCMHAYDTCMHIYLCLNLRWGSSKHPNWKKSKESRALRSTCLIHLQLGGPPST